MGNAPEHDSVEFRLELWRDLEVLFHARSLIEARMLLPFTPRRHLCAACLAEAVFGAGDGVSSRRVKKDLEMRLKRRLRVQARINDEELEIEFDISRLGVVDHQPKILIIEPIPDIIRGDEELYRALKSGLPVRCQMLR